MFHLSRNQTLFYTFLYLTGTIENGKLTGTWNYPAPSSTNAVLLGAEAMNFFIQQINADRILKNKLL